MGRERRRLLIDPAQRVGDGRQMVLSESERHYLRRVLRLRIGDQVDVVNGCGGLWLASLEASDRLTLTSDPDQPQLFEPRPEYRVGLVVALMRRDTDVWIRMACELGIDDLYPVLTERCVPQAEQRQDRWQSIVQESVEQCERLWTPHLHPVLPLRDCLERIDGRVAMAVTRRPGCSPLSAWLRAGEPPQQTWLLVGPEGGWSADENVEAAGSRVTPVALGRSILRSSTAAVRGAVELVQWRESVSAP
ncbi:MAG: 16S rRNA (uracil(1498)-N(3))-methyltransferase [Synechococcus sp.]